MGQGGQAGVVQGRDQQAGGDADTLGDVVVLLLVALPGAAALLAEDGDQDRRDRQRPAPEGLADPGSESKG